MTLIRTIDPNAHTFERPEVIAAKLRVFTKAVEEGDLSACTVGFRCATA